jgi:hypothetical protein
LHGRDHERGGADPLLSRFVGNPAPPIGGPPFILEAYPTADDDYPADYLVTVAGTSTQLYLWNDFIDTRGGPLWARGYGRVYLPGIQYGEVEPYDGPQTYRVWSVALDGTDFTEHLALSGNNAATNARTTGDQFVTQVPGNQFIEMPGGAIKVLRNKYEALETVAPPVLAFRSASSAVTSGTSHSCSLPSGHAPGDILLMAVRMTRASSASPASPTPFGWVRRAHHNSTFGGLDHNYAVYSKASDGFEDPTLTLSTGASSTGHIVILAYSGTGSVDTFGDYGSIQATATPTVQSVTTTQANDIVVGFVFSGAAASGTPASGWTERADHAGTIGDLIYAMDIPQASAGASPAAAPTLSASSDCWTYAFSIKPHAVINVGPAALYVYDAATDTHTQIVSPDDFDAEYRYGVISVLDISDDCSQVAFAHHNSPNGIGAPLAYRHFCCDTDGSNFAELDMPVSPTFSLNPRFNPSGNGELVYIAPDGTGFHTVYANGDPDGGAFWNTTGSAYVDVWQYSPDGTRIAVVIWNGTAYELLTIASDGSDEDTTGYTADDNVRIAWDPDGTSVAVLYESDPGELGLDTVHVGTHAVTNVVVPTVGAQSYGQRFSWRRAPLSS